MPPEPSLATLREAVKRARSNALRKRRRFQTPGDGYIQIEGTKYDPIRPPHVHDKYNRKQLISYLEELKNFNSRKTQFVPDAYHKPIPKEKWERYKKVEAAYNSKVEAFAHKFDKIVKPHAGGATPSMMYKIANPDHMAGNSPVNGAKRKLMRKPRQIMSEAKLDKLTRNLLKSFDDKNVRKELGSAYLTVRDILYRYADENGDNFVDLFKNLSAEQFEYFWYFSPNEVNEFFLWYESIKALDRDGDEAHPAYMSLHDSARQNVVDFFEDVQKKIKGVKPARVNKWGYLQPSIPRTRQKGAKKKKGKNSQNRKNRKK